MILLCWLMLKVKGIKAKPEVGTWIQSYLQILHDKGLKFYENVRIFPKIYVSLKTRLQFLRGALDAAFP